MEVKNEIKTPETKAEPKEVKEVKMVKLTKFSEVEAKVKDAIAKGDTDLVLLLNELTLARNLDTELSKAEQKQLGVIYVAFKGSNGVVKRAGVYNTMELTNSELAEDILIGEDFKDERVLAVPRNSSFADQLCK